MGSQILKIIVELAHYFERSLLSIRIAPICFNS